MPAALSMQEPSWTLVDSMSMAALGPKYSITAYVLCVRRAVFLRTALEVNVSSEILTMSLDHVRTAAARVSELRMNLAKHTANRRVSLDATCLAVNVVERSVMPLSFVNVLPRDVSSMRVSLGSDRLVSNAHTCSPARLQYANVVRPSQKPSVRRHCCTCSAAASTSGATEEEQQVNKLGRIQQATRAAKHAYRLCLAQAHRVKMSHLTDRSSLHIDKMCGTSNLR